jgi:phosphonate degradation associated HDIG domain protein
MPLTVDQIILLYRIEGAARHGREPVSQQEHALQCGLLAQEADASPDLVAAALLHDLGNLLVPADPELQDNRHEVRVLPFLRGMFPAAVLDPIRLHVAAKRYLCAVDPGYQDTLSPASRSSLALQGGPLGQKEAKDFLREPHALDAVALRQWDDLAKSPTRPTPGWEHFRAVLQAVRLRPVAALLS